MYGSIHRRPILAGLCALALLASATGCETARARVLRPTCQRVEQGDALVALTFKSTIETEGIVGEQLVYEVSLRNAALRPIKSTDGRYQNKAGAVAASKTLMVLQNPTTFESVPLTIPVEQLQIRKGDWPVSAVFRLYNISGECIAQASCPVPSQPARRAAVATEAPARPAPVPDRRATSQPTTRPKPQPTVTPTTTTRPTTLPATWQTSQPTTQPTAEPTTRPAKPRPEPVEPVSPRPARPTRPRGRTG